MAILPPPPPPPVEGSPALTDQVTFIPSAVLGAPSIGDSKAPGNFSAAWLNAGITGLSNNAVIGTLQITLPGSGQADCESEFLDDFTSPKIRAIHPLCQEALNLLRALVMITRIKQDPRLAFCPLP